MRTAILIVTVLAISPVVHAAGTAYYRPQDAAAQSAEGKKNAADEKADLDAKKAQATKADEDAAAAEKAHAKDAATKRQRTRDLDAQLAQQYQQAQATHLKHLGDRIDRIVPTVRKAHHLDALIAAPAGSDVAPSVDLTAEVVRRLDAGEGTSEEDLTAENARLKAKVAALEAAKKPDAQSTAAVRPR